jgi:hypothetical protein
MTNLFKLITELFDGDLITVMFSSLSNSFISIEFKVANSEFAKYVNFIETHGCLDVNLQTNLNEVTVPGFVDYMTFKFQWKDESHMALYLTAVTENKETIKNILDPD